MSGLRSFDEWLIERVFEPFAWRFEYHTGFNNFWLARAVLIIWPLSMVATLWGVIQEAGGLVTVAMGLVIICGSLISAAVHFFHSFYVEETQRPNVASLERVYWRSRLYSLFAAGCVGAAGLYFLALGMCALACSSYLQCCSPMPPQWLEEQEEKELAPVPT